MWLCDEAIESYDEDGKVKPYGETKTISTNSNEKKITCKRQRFYVLLAFLLITIALLIAKQKPLLPFHFTNNELKEIIYYEYK